MTKTLYEFAFCVGEINDDFSIETVVPRRMIPCSSVETLVQCGIDHSCLLTVSYSSDVDILQSLSEGKQQEYNKEESFTSVLEKADERREQFASEKFQQPARVRTISRSNIFDHVMDLFSDESFLKEYPLHIKFEGEVAVDLGGVRRDMLSGYWEEAYKRFFDGSTLLIPTVHPNIDVSLLSKLGVILSHGYLVCGFMPTRIAFPSVACILLDTSITIPTKILVESFTECLSVHEAAILKHVLTSSTTFSNAEKDTLITVFSHYGCRSCPTPENIHSLTTNTARIELQMKPMAAYSMIASGIPLDERLLAVVFFGRIVCHLHGN